MSGKNLLWVRFAIISDFLPSRKCENWIRLRVHTCAAIGVLVANWAQGALQAKYDATCLEAVVLALVSRGIARAHCTQSARALAFD